MRDVPFAGLYFSTYESFKYVQRVSLLDADAQARPLSHVNHLLAGALAGSFASICTLPMDVVKLRIQTQETLPADQKVYKSIGDCWKKIYALEGVRGFFKGWSPVLIKVTPAASITFACYEAFKNYFDSS